jgi:hypothetical protein
VADWPSSEHIPLAKSAEAVPRKRTRPPTEAASLAETSPGELWIGEEASYAFRVLIAFGQAAPACGKIDKRRTRNAIGGLLGLRLAFGRVLQTIFHIG